MMKSPDRKNRIVWMRMLPLILVAVLAFGAGLFIDRSKTSKTEKVSSQAPEQIWTCSMHPQIRQNKPGQCPICFMDLIPVETGDSAAVLGPRQISFSPEAVKLMEIQTAPVERKAVEAQVRMVGKVDYDETRIKHVTAWAPGRIDRLYVDFTGTQVIRGDHMVRIYSPELISAQAEYLQAGEAVESMSESVSSLIRNSNTATLKAAREKLLLLGLTEAQLQEIDAKGTPLDYLTINAPAGGIVLEKHLNEGTYVKTGTMIYTIADLSEVWVILNAYESDIEMVTYLQDVEFTAESYPGETFKGRITFISPTLDTKTRTVKLRVNVPNPAGRLKPGMFVRGVVHAKLSDAGVISDPNLLHSFVCPMHPSVVKEAPGTCDICGMELVPAESTIFARTGQTGDIPLVIPATAPLITGKRAVVYVRVPDMDRPVFEGREVLLGLRAGDDYIVKKGLSEGETVVTNGNFKIDSALQILAKPSMMSPDPDSPAALHTGHAAMQSREQTLCPVMGGPINKKYFIEYKGKKVYFCCPGCDEIFLENPEQYIDKLPQFQNDQ